jgi:UDP-glucose 4-epimerase
LKILVTGAAGGIGSLLSHQLHLSGYDIHLVDDLSNGYLHNLERYNLLRYLSRVDITDEVAISGVFQDFNPDVVIHLAALTSLPQCQTNPAAAIQANLVGTAVLLENARVFGVKLFIHTSTSAVYENTASETFNEDDVCRPTLIYPLVKLQSESLCKSYFDTYGLPTLIFRLFNVFGPWQDYERTSPPLFNYLVREYSFNRIPILHSTGEQSRDYLSVHSVVDAYLKALKICVTYDFDSTVINLCSGSSISVKEIDRIVRDELDVKFNPTYVPSAQFWKSYEKLNKGKYPIKKEVIESEVNKLSKGDRNKAKNILDWEPQDNEKAIREYANLAFEWLNSNGG